MGWLPRPAPGHNSTPRMSALRSWTAMVRFGPWGRAGQPLPCGSWVKLRWRRSRSPSRRLPRGPGGSKPGRRRISSMRWWWPSGSSLGCARDRQQAMRSSCAGRIWISSARSPRRRKCWRFWQRPSRASAPGSWSGCWPAQSMWSTGRSSGATCCARTEGTLGKRAWPVFRVGCGRRCGRTGLWTRWFGSCSPPRAICMPTVPTLLLRGPDAGRSG